MLLGIEGWAVIIKLHVHKINVACCAMTLPGFKDQRYINKVKNKLTRTYRKLKNFTLLVSMVDKENFPTIITIIIIMIIITIIYNSNILQ